MPSLRPRAMLIAARSSGRPTRVFADRVDHELVELVADFARQAAHQAAGRARRVQRHAGTAAVEGRRVEEGIEQPDVVLGAVGVQAGDDLRQHRVAEAVDGVREFRGDRAVDRGDAAEERVDQRLDFARELLEHEVLILHLGAEARRLEEALVVVPARAAVDRVPRRGFRRRQHARRTGRAGHEPIDVVREAIVLGVEQLVNCGQRDVLVAAAVAGDEVRVEQLVVVGAWGLRRLQAGAGHEIGVRLRPASAPRCARCR